MAELARALAFGSESKGFYSPRFPSCMQQNYDSSAFRVSPGGYFTNLLNQDSCKQLCTDVKLPYAGLVLGEYCLCSNHTADLEKADTALCDKYCIGSVDEICGSNDTDLIYVMEAEFMGTVDSIEITFDEDIFYADKAVKITFKVISSAHYSVTVHFGDGTSHKMLSEPYKVEKNYKVPGKYKIFASAIDIAELNQAVTTDSSIKVEDKAINFDIDCPKVTEPVKESQCNVTMITGSNNMLTYQMSEDVEPSEEIVIIDPFYVALGQPIPVVMNEFEYCSVDEQEVHLSYANVKFKSYLIGFEFLSKETGSIKFLVLRPLCSSGSYCEETFDCSSTCSANNIRTCNQDNVLCSLSSQCVNPDSPSDCSVKPFFDYEYEVKYSFDVTIDSGGYNYYDVPEKEKHIVLPGDTIGFKTDGLSLWCRNSTEWEIENGMEDRSPETGLGVLHFLQVVVAEEVNVSLRYIYNDIGNHSVTVSVSNMEAAEVVEKKTYLPVQIPVSAVSLEVIQINAVIGKDIKIKLSAVNGSDFSVIWEYFKKTEEEIFSGVRPDGYFKDITCESTGEQVITANVSNLWCSEVVSAKFYCFSPIGREWSFTSDSPKSLPPGKLEFNLKFEGSTLPSLATFELDFGDGSTNNSIDIVSDSDEWEISFSHSYEQKNNYTVSVNISNPADFEIFEIEVRVKEKLHNLTVIPWICPLNKYPADKSPLLGPDMTDAAVESVIYFEVSVSGEATKFIMDSGDTSLQQESDDNIFNHQFISVGEWEISFKAYDSETDEYSNEVTVTIRIMELVTKVEFEASNLDVTTDDIVEFSISVDTIDSYTCIMFKSGDSSRNLAFGNENVCTLYYLDSSYRFISKSSRSKRDVTKTEWKDDKTLSILYQYMYGGEFTPSVDVFNPISRIQDDKALSVNEADYMGPLVWIDHNSTDITNPIKRKRGYDFRLETTSVFRTNASYIASHRWSLFKIDEQGNELEEIDLSSLKTSNCSALRVVQTFLDCGNYKLKYTLTVYEEEFQKEKKERDIYDDYYSRKLNGKLQDEDEEFYYNFDNMTILTSKTVYTYLEIIQTALIPTIIHGGASYVLRGVSQTINLEPTIYTIDPDYPDEREFSVKWFCLRYNSEEELTKVDKFNYDESNPSAPITDRSNINQDDNKGGCFGKGPGLMNIGSGDYELKCSSFWELNTVYEIVAVISKDEKFAESHLLVEVIEENPPSLSVMCGKDKDCYPQVLGQYINPNSFIPFKTECLEHCGADGDLRFEWKVYSSDLKTMKKDPIDAWESHLLIDKERIGINQTLFTLNPDIKTFLVEVTGSLPDFTIPEGVSFMFLMINNPPENGDCRLSHTPGMALIDVFEIEFDGWQDVDGHSIVDYSVYVKYDDKMMRLSYGLKSKLPVVLPYGELEVWCSVQDDVGGSTMYHVAHFFPMLPTEEEFAEYEEQRMFDKCLAEGKMSMASQIAIAKASVEKEYQRRNNETDGVSEASVNQLWHTFIDQEGIDSSYFTIQAKDEIREMLTEEYEKRLDEEAKTKSKKLDKLLKLPMEALADAEIFGGAIAAVADSGPSDSHAKSKLMEGIENMYDVINQTEISHPVDLKVVLSQFGGIADSLAGSLADANIAGKFLPKELKRAREELDNNATEPNFFIYYVDGSQEIIKEKLHDRSVDAAKEGQFETSKEMVTEIKNMMSNIQQSCMKELMVGSDPFSTESSNGFQLTFVKKAASELSGNVIHQKGSSVSLPDVCKMLDTDNCEDEAFGVMSAHWTQPLESYGKGSEKLSDSSSVIQIEIMPRNGSSVIPVQNSSEPFTICIPHSDSDTQLEHVVPTFSSESDILVYHTTYIDSPGAAVIVNIVPDNYQANLVLLFKYGEQPSLLDYDSIMKVSKIPVKNGMHSLVIGADFITEPGQNLSVAIGHFSAEMEVDAFFKNPHKYNLTIFNMTNEFNTNYSIGLAVTGCYYFDDEKEIWSTKGCKVASNEPGLTCCECNHLSSFGSGFFIAPNQIDFDYVFANAGFNTNVTIYATVIVLLAVFILFLIYARWKDRKDLQMLGASPLPDNEATDKYVYEILVFTGHQRNAGTKSNVFFIVSGEDEETEVRHLADDKRSILQKGSVDVFVMSVPRSLGQLNYLRIWHDNTGKGRWSSWYCQYIVFRDVQTGLKYEFLVNKWFGVEYEDGLIDRLFPVAGKQQVTEFSHLFSTNSRRNLADNHLWFSVFLRPPRSRFTRVQRVCCCMAVMCLSMLTNAMYYERTTPKPSSGGFKLGPLSLTPEQIAVGLISNFLIFPPTFLMIIFFRKSRPKVLRPSRVDLALKNQKEEWQKQNQDTPTAKPKNVTDAEAQLYHRKKKFTFPWWCVYFGWLLVIISIGASLFFVWAYGIEFGDEKTSKWLTSLVIAFFSSVLLTQPLKILLMAIVLSCFCRSVDYDEDDADEDEEDPHLQPDEAYLHEGRKRSKKISYRPMDLEALEEARKEREKEVKMYSIIQEVSAYFVFLWIVMILSYGNRDPNNFYLRESLINGFIKPGDLWVDFNNVNTEKKFWNWTYNALIPELFASPWYNKKDPLGLRLYLDDRNNLKISYGVMRQVRIKPRSCKVYWLLEETTPECAGFGNMLFEDGTLYTKHWQIVDSNDTLVPPEYKYLSASQLKGYPFWGQVDWYGGGGYVVPLVSRRDSDVEELKKKLARLEKDGWIDRHTRAVFVEFGVYNAQINLFCSVTILAEFLPGGGVIPYFHIDPIRLLNYHKGFGFFQMIIEVLFIIFTIYFTFRELIKMGKHGMSYFGDVWNIAELVSLVVSYTGIANQVYKLFMTAEILRIFNETEGTGYVKLQEAVLLNDLFCYQIGLIMSIATLKFLKLLRFNKRIGMLSSTLSMCAHELKSYSVCLMVVFGAFVILFWLLLGRYVREFSTFIYSFESSISMMLKKFNYEDMYAAQPVFTPIAFFTFSLATAVVLVNILLSIIIRSFEEVKHNENLQSNEYEIFDFFINRVKMTLGCGTSKVRPLPSMYRDKKKPPDTVSSFPDKVDKLVGFINSFYFENQMDFNSIDLLKKMNVDSVPGNGDTIGGRKKARPVKAQKSKIPKSLSERFNDF